MRFSISPASESERNAIAAGKRWKRERKKEVCGKRRGRGKGPEKEVNDEVEEEAEGGRCESSALTLGFDARP